MQKIMLFILFLFSQNGGAAQDVISEKAQVKLTISPAFENEKSRTNILAMMRDHEGNILLIKRQVRMFGKINTLIEKYSPQLKQIFSKELQIIGTEGKDLDFHSACTVNGEPTIFSSYYNKEKDTRYFFASKILEKGVLGKPQKISQLSAESRNEGGFSVHFSKDSTKILVVNFLETRRKEKAKFSFVVLDPTLKTIWEANVTMPFETRDLVLSDFAVDSAARVFVLATADNDAKGKDEADFVQEIFLYENGATKPKRFNLKLKGKLVSALRLHENQSGELVAVGIFASARQRNVFFSHDRTSPLGTVFIKIDGNSGEVLAKSVNQFSDKTFAFMNINPKKIEDGKGIDYLGIHDSWVDSDNSICLDLEQNHVIVTTQRQGNFVSYNYHYYSQMAMLVRLDADGKVLHETIIPKRMSSLNDETGLRHIVLGKQTGGKTFFVFNDNPKNWGIQAKNEKDIRYGVTPESGSISFKKKPHVVLCTVDANGKRSFARIFDFKKDDVFLNTESSLRYDEKSVVVVGSYFKDFKLVKIEF